jgi:hypothetical protein
MVLRALQARPVWTALTVQLALKALKVPKARQEQTARLRSPELALPRNRPTSQSLR